MTDLTEFQIRHLEIIQSVITRMNSNSFALKALAGTITAAVIAYFGAVDDAPWQISLAGVVPAVVFWLLDAQYLRLERLFRKLYDGVRKGTVSEPFDMNFTRYHKEVDDVLLVAGSWSISWFYLTLVVILTVIAFMV